MIRYKGFKGFFIMKKDPESTWKYMSIYWRKNDFVKMEFSDTDIRYFSDNTIRTGLAWDVFGLTKKLFPESKVVLYAMIDDKPERLVYYNPEAERKITRWHNKEDFYCFAPQKEIR